jgi:NAD(P)H dehydrogenase (quinone)
VVLFSRSREGLPGARFADFDRPDSLTDAFTGVDVLLLISTDAVGRRRAQHKAAITAAAAAGVSRIVYTSMPNADSTFPARLRPLSDDHWATEVALQKAGPAWTVLRNSLYFEATGAGWAHAAEQGALVTNNGDGRRAPVTRDDQAIATALAGRYGRSVEVGTVADADYEAGLIAAGLPEELAGVLTGFGESIRAGLLETPLGDFEKLTGRPPVSIEEYLAG